MGCFSSKDADGKPAPKGNQVVPDGHFDVAADYLGPRGRTETLKNARGADLKAYLWPAADGVPLKGVIQLAHGNATYICFDYLKFQGVGLPNLYEGSWVQAFNDAGFAVCGIDHEGFGRSSGKRSFIQRFQQHVDNFLLLSDHVKATGGEEFPVDRVPHFIVAHSMGGLVATLATLQQPGRFAGLLMLAPMLSLEARIKENAAVRPVLKVISAAAPEHEVGSSSDTRHVPWIYDAWDADPYVYDGGMRARNVEEFFKTTEALQSEMPRVCVPFLVFQSERDTHVDPSGAKRLHEVAESTDKKLVMLTKQWHVLTKEDGWEELLAQSLAWLGEHTRKTLAPEEAPAASAKAEGEAAGGEGGSYKGHQQPPADEPHKHGENGQVPAAKAAHGDAAAEAKAKETEEAGLVRRAVSESEAGLVGGELPQAHIASLNINGQMPLPPLPQRANSATGLKPLAPFGALAPLPRRSLGQLPPELANGQRPFTARSRLPPLVPIKRRPSAG